MRDVRFYLLVAAVGLLLPGTAAADGKVYSRENVPPSIPYQRALITFTQRSETLIVQSKYEPAPGSTPKSLGWIVPVPAVPEIRTMSAKEADQFFHMADGLTHPKVVSVVPTILSWIPLATAASGLLALILRAVAVFWPNLLTPSRKRRVSIYGWSAIGAGLVMFVAFAAFINYFKTAGPSQGVEIVSAAKVGIFNTHVIRARSSADLVTWLAVNQLHSSSEDARVLDDYVSRGWCFVAAKVDAKDLTGEEAVSGGLLAPLILRFPSSKPVYPMALTATVGKPTQILVYLVSDRKWSSDGRLALRYYHQKSDPAWNWLDLERPPGLSPSEVERNLRCVSKFKGTLTAEQMKKDMEWSMASDNETYIEKEYRWW